MDRRYIEFYSFEKKPMFKKLSGTLQIGYSFQNLTGSVNYVLEQYEHIGRCDLRKSLSLGICQVSKLRVVSNPGGGDNLGFLWYGILPFFRVPFYDRGRIYWYGFHLSVTFPD